jgi:hypothetical protein
MNQKTLKLIEDAKNIHIAGTNRAHYYRVIDELIAVVRSTDEELDSIKSATRGIYPDLPLTRGADDLPTPSLRIELKPGELEKIRKHPAPREPGLYFDEQGRNWHHSVASMPGQPPHWEQWYDWRGQKVSAPDIKLTPVGGHHTRVPRTNPQALRSCADEVLAGEGLLERAELDSATVDALLGAASEIDHFQTWNGLMELLDMHWPTDVFPFYEDAAERDKGPRIVSLIRALDAVTTDRNGLLTRLSKGNQL